jgi:hypothetical protein
MIRFLVILLVMVVGHGALAGTPEQTALELELEQEAHELSQRFVGELKPQLKLAMEQGGPTRAIEVCATEAPKIADSLSAQSGWRVKRVSLKSRNASRAQPDQWEREVLQQFNQRQQAGEAAADINYSASSSGQYRYMQAQGVEPLCLICHGKGLSDPVQLTLEKYYPDDWATGYSLGQVRGAISLSKSM